MEYTAQTHPDVLSLLCEGDSSTWDAKAWTFDEDALKAAPNKDHVPPQGLQHMSCCAYKRSRGATDAEATAEGKAGSCCAPDSLADGPVTSCCAPLDLSSFGQAGPDAKLQMNGTAEHHGTENPGAAFNATYGLTPEAPAGAPSSAPGPMGVADSAIANMGGTATGTAPPWFPQAPSVVPFMQSNMNMQGGESNVKTERPFIPPDAITLQTARKDLGPNRCWVLGCEKDVTDLREFHLRYHICDEHIRANCILRNGSPERFCQQCARFHSVELFDGNRRSCRVQLQKHNERRRKRTNPKAAEAAAAAAAAAAQNASGDDKDAVQKAIHNGTMDLNNFTNQRPQLSQAPGAGMPMGNFQGVMNGNNCMMDIQSLQLPDFSQQRLLGASADLLGPFGGSGSAPGSVNSRDAMVHEMLQALMSNPSLALSLRRLMLSDSEGSNKISDARASHLSSATAQLANPSPPSAVSNRTVRLSFKLLRCLPDDLPADLKPQLLRWLDAAPSGVEGCIRPGCVMLTVQATVTMQNYARLRRLGLVSLVMHLLCSGCTFWHRVNMVVQAFNSVAICSKGKLISIQDVSAPTLSSSLPQLDAVSTHVLLSDGHSPLNLGLKGARLNTPGVSIIVRQGANCSLLTSTSARDATTTDIQIAVPSFTNGCAVVWVEAQIGGYLTQALPVLVCTGIQLAGHVHTVSHDLVTRAAAAASFAEAHHWMLCNERLLMGIYRPMGIVAPPLPLCPIIKSPPVLMPCNTPRAASLNNFDLSRGSSNGSCCGANLQPLIAFDGPVLGVPVPEGCEADPLLEPNLIMADHQSPSGMSNCCASSVELFDVSAAGTIEALHNSSQCSQPENFDPCNAKAAPKACQCNVGSSFDAVREMLCPPLPLLDAGFDDGSDEEFAIFLDQLFPDIVAT